jgi:hypothetical protein
MRRKYATHRAGRAAVFAAPVELPAIITKIAGYLAVAGSVMGAVSQTAVLHEEE